MEGMGFTNLMGCFYSGFDKIGTMTPHIITNITKAFYQAPVCRREKYLKKYLNLKMLMENIISKLVML